MAAAQCERIPVLPHRAGRRAEDVNPAPAEAAAGTTPGDDPPRQGRQPQPAKNRQNFEVLKSSFLILKNKPKRGQHTHLKQRPKISPARSSAQRPHLMRPRRATGSAQPGDGSQFCDICESLKNTTYTVYFVPVILLSQAPETATRSTTPS